MLLSCAPKHNAPALRRSPSTPAFCESQKFNASISNFEKSDVPNPQSLLHSRHAGSLHPASEEASWKQVSNQQSAAHNASTPVSYVSSNASLTKIEFGFPKVDQRSRETLSRGIAALNKMLEAEARTPGSKTKSENGGFVPRFAFHESHYPENFREGTDLGDFTKYHPMGLTHVDGRRATHYHYTLEWTKLDKSQQGEPPIGGDTGKLAQTAQTHLPLLLNFLGQQKLIGNAEAFGQKLGLKQPVPSQGAVAGLDRQLASLPSAPASPTHWYDTLAAEGAKADARHPLTLNLERTPEEVLNHAARVVLHAQGLAAPTPAAPTQAGLTKRLPGLEEFFDQFHAAKFGADASTRPADRLTNKNLLLAAIKLPSTQDLSHANSTGDA